MDEPAAEIIWLHSHEPAGRSAGSAAAARLPFDLEAEMGAKSTRLAQLARAGFPVPAGFCLPAGAYRRHVLAADPPRLQALLASGDFARLREWITRREIDPGDRAALLAAYRRLQPQAPLGVAVRSSASAEDLVDHSFAGLYTSVLNVSEEEELLQAVRTIWASCWNDEAVAYLQTAGIDPASRSMAVLVQAMAPAALAGVIFTRVSPREPHLALVEFTLEGGDALMNGAARGIRLFVDRRSGRPVRSPGGEHELDVSRLLALALQLEDLLGAPQDVEWTMDAGGNLWIVQTRPITTLPAGELDRQNSGEWRLTYDEPFSPLGVEIAIERYRYWVAGINANFKTRFPAEMRAQDGLLYYRPTWRSPGRLQSLWINFWRLVAWLNAEQTRRRYTEQILPDYNRRLAEIEQTPLSEQSGAALLEHLRAGVQAYLDFQYTSYAVGAAATLAAGILGLACRLLFPRGSRWDALDFLTGLDDISIRRELEVYRLGRLLQPFLPPCADNLAELWEQVDPSGPFWAALQPFLREYGYLWADRYPRDPAWELNQEALTTSLWMAAQSPPEESLAARHQAQQHQRAATVQAALDQLSRPRFFPIRRWIFTLLLRRAESLFPYKEHRNHATYRGMMVIRQVARELGRRLQRRQLLPSVEDLFFLELNEIEMLWNNPKTASWLLAKVEQRKAVYRRSRQRSRQHGAPPNGRAGASLELHGDPCSPGLAQGPARLVSGPGELQRVRPGEIVVCSQLRPAWSAVFARAGAVVIEMGSLLSHGSTLAREYGIPAVINVADITALVRENDWLVVDGNVGRVAIQRQPAPEVEQ